MQFFGNGEPALRGVFSTRCWLGCGSQRSRLSSEFTAVPKAPRTHGPETQRESLLVAATPGSPAGLLDAGAWEPHFAGATGIFGRLT